MKAMRLPDFITAAVGSPARRTEVHVDPVIYTDATLGHLGIAHALEKAGRVHSDDYHRLYGGGEYVEPADDRNL